MAKEIITGLKNRTYDLALGPDISEKDSSIVFDLIVEDYMLLAVPKSIRCFRKQKKRRRKISMDGYFKNAGRVYHTG